MLQGDGLSGPDHLEVQARGSAMYPLTFAPNLAGQAEGRSERS